MERENINTKIGSDLQKSAVDGNFGKESATRDVDDARYLNGAQSTAVTQRTAVTQSSAAAAAQSLKGMHGSDDAQRLNGVRSVFRIFGAKRRLGSVLRRVTATVISVAVLAGMLIVPPPSVSVFSSAAAPFAPLASTPVFANGEFDINTTEFTAAPVDLSNPKVLNGYEQITDMFRKIYYDDISRVFGKREIVRMTALGAINTFGAREFRPADSITGYEALSQVIGLIGGEANVVRNVQDAAGTTTPPERMKLMLNKAYYDDAVAKGILLSNEILGLGSPITAERAALFLARAIGIDQVYGQTDVYSFQDWKQVEQNARPHIEALVKKGVIPLKSNGNFEPRNPIARAEFATWLSSAFDASHDKFGYGIGYGVVVSVETKKKQEGANEIIEYDITLKSPKGETVILHTERIGYNMIRDFVVYRDGIVSSSRILKRGDEVEYVYRGDEVKFVGSLPKGRVLLSLATKDEKYFYTHFAKVADIKTTTESRDGKTLIREIYRVIDITGDAFDIIVTEDGATGLRTDIMTFKGDAVGGVKLLSVGDSIEYVTDNRQKIGYIKVREPLKRSISGTINRTEPATENSPEYVTIYDYEENLWRYPLAPYVSLTINERLATLQDFAYGLEVKAFVVDDMIVSLSGESYRSEPGYIPPFGKMRMGKVYAKRENEISVRKYNGAPETIYIDSQTQFTRNGVISSFNTLKVGEELKAYYSNIYSDKADRIEIQGFEKRFANIYKGRLKNFVPQTGELYLVGSDGISKPEYSSNNKWAQTDEYAKDLAIADDCEIYFNNQRLSPEALERFYKGYDVYAVTEEHFGRETAVKISVRAGAEMVYSGTLRNYDTTLKEMELTTKENFAVTDATIFVKDGHLVTASGVNRRDTLFVAAEYVDGGSDKNAMFVNVTSKRDTIFESIRIGAVETVSTSSLTLRNHTHIVDHRFEKVNPNTSGSYKLTTNTQIKDISDPDKIKIIQPNKFVHNKYGRTENYETGKPGLKYKRYYAFMVVNPSDHSVLAMNMRKGGLMERNLFDYKLKKEEDIQTELAKTFKDAVMTRGVVTGKDETWQRFEITEAHDFTHYRSVWTPTETNIYVKYADAIVVKNNRIITINDIKIGDYIYVLRIGTDSLVIFVD